ncbi:MAG: hypothetical protein WC319_15585 [Candidatus Paceibacterota bacterium]|jgi:hypothetical protein
MYKFIGKKNQAYDIKLNYNCPDSEKSGSGPGSCGGAAIKDKVKAETEKPKSEKISETLTRYTSGKQQAYVQTMPGKQGQVTFGNKWEKTFDTIEEANNAANEFAKSGKMPNDVKPRRHPLEVKNTRK